MMKASANLSILVVGNIDHLLVSKQEFPEISNTVFCSMNDLTAEFISAYQPDIILSPLMTSQFDVLELAIKLDRLNFEGRFRAITSPLPDPYMILREVRFECPALDFDLIVLRPGQHLRSV